MSIFALDGIAILWPACRRCHGLPAVVVVKAGTPHERCWCYACAALDTKETWEWLTVPAGEEA